MRWAITLLACVFGLFALFAAFRTGINRGRLEGARIAPAVAEGARYETTSKIGSTVGNPNLWEGMSREQFQERMSDSSQRHFGRLQAAWSGLESWQREAVIAELWESLSEEEEKRLREIPLPPRGN